MSSSRCVPFFDYPAIFHRDEAYLLPIMHDVLKRGAFIMQKDLRQFEENLSIYLGVKHVIGVADGTVALMMGLRAAQVGKGDEVIVPSHTFIASAAAIHHVGATPVLADCGPDHLIDPLDVERKISSRTKAVMPVQLNGRTSNMTHLLSICETHNLTIIEDSAQALGSKFKGRFAGTFGLVGTCSFYPSKTLGCFGDGGAVFTNSDAAADFMRLLRDHGRTDTGDVACWGYNSRLDNLQAAILDYKLSRYDEDIARRREIASIYHENLKSLSQLTLPPAPDADPDHFDIYQNYEVECLERDALRTHLHQDGIGTIIQWGGRVIHQFSSLKLNKDVPFTDALVKRFFLLPMNTTLSNDDVHYVCKSINSFYRN